MEEKVTVNVNSQNIQEIEQLTLVSLFLTIKRNLKIFIIGIALVFFISLFIFFKSIFITYTQLAALQLADTQLADTQPVGENPIVAKHYIFIQSAMIIDGNNNKYIFGTLTDLIYKAQRIFIPKAISQLVSYKEQQKGNLEFVVESQADVDGFAILFDQKLASPKYIDYPALLRDIALRVLHEQDLDAKHSELSNLTFIPGRIIEELTLVVSEADDIEVIVEKNIDTIVNDPAIPAPSSVSPSFMAVMEEVDKKRLLIPILGLIIGVLLGLILVFGAEFLRKVKDVEDKL